LYAVKIVKWRQFSKPATESKKMPTRKEIIMFLSNCYSMSDLMPPKPCALPSIGLDIDVSVYPFLGSINSLLSSPELMKSKI